MQVLITGGTGYLGSAIVRAAARAGHTPVVFARGATRSGLPGALVDGDIRDRAAVRSAARGVDAICHTAALVSVWRTRREDFDEINVGGLHTIIDVATALQIPRIVYTSSFLARPPAGHETPIAANDYQRTKVAAREVARDAVARGVPVVSLVPGVVYGEGMATEGNLVGRLVHDHLAGRLPGIIGGDRLWSFSFIDDVAAAHVAALGRGAAGGEYLLGGENAPQVRLFEVLSELKGTGIPRRIPYGVAWAIGAAEELRARAFGATPLLTRGVVEIFSYDWPLDSRAAVDSLGYLPTPLRQGLRRMLEPAGTGARP